MTSAPVVPAPIGWNTWDVRDHTGMTHLPSNLRVRFGLLGPDGPVIDGFTWRHGLVRLGHHSVDGAYAEVVVAAAGAELHLTMAGGPTDTLHVRAASTVPIVVAVDGPFGEWQGDQWQIDTSTPADACGDVLVVGTGTVDVSVSLAGTPGSARDVGSIIEQRRAEADAHRLQSSGWLGGSGDALMRAVTWNTIYVPDLGRVITPTSRDFVSAARDGFYQSWALHAWDTFFTGLVASVVDRDYARGIFAQILPYADDAGMIPNRVSDDRGRTDDRSQPPVGALTVHRSYLASGLDHDTRDRELLATTFPAVVAWHDWWPTARRGPHGLLAWGSHPIDGDVESATLDRAKRESGLDDSPMYDEATFDAATNTMGLADVGLNALHIADADALADIAEVLGERAEARRLREEAAEARRRADALLWDAGLGGYRNLRADGQHDPHVSPTMLYPLLASMASDDRARALASDLLAPDVLGGPRPLPSVARNDPGFGATYWRGRIWGPMAYLAVESLRRQGLDDLSRPLVDALLRMFLTEWEEFGHVRENYPAHEGEDVRDLRSRSDGLMAWGGLLTYVAFGELADARRDGWRFAHPGTPATLCGLPLGDGRLDVAAAERLRVSLDGRTLIDAAPGVVVSRYRRNADRVSGLVSGTGDVLIARPDGGGLVAFEVDESACPFVLGPNA